MSDQQSIITGMFHLLDTIKEGLQHIEKRLGEGHFEDTAYLFEDIKEAFSSIFKTIEPVIPEHKMLGELTDKLLIGLEAMNSSYENKKLDQARIDLQFMLFPAYRSWQEEMQKCFGNLVES